MTTLSPQYRFMTNISCSRLLTVRLAAVLVLLASLHSSLQGQLFRGAPRRVERKQQVTAPVSPADAKEQLQRLTSEIKENPRKITDSDLNRCQKLLLEAVNDLQRRLPREFDKATANDWKTTFQLAELKAALEKGKPDQAILETVQNAFYSDKEGVRWVLFNTLRTALRRYQTIARILEEGSYEGRLTNVCDNLVKYIDTYSEGRDPLYFLALSDAAVWLEDISPFEPRAARLAELTRGACSGVNVRLQVGSDLISSGFHKEINQVLDIDETILGTKVVGDGNIVGASNAELVNSPTKAAIKVLAEAVLETNTDGSQAMVTLKNYTTGMLRGEKQILLSAEAVTTTPAKTKANLSSQVSDVKINAGPVIRMVARGQIDSRKADSQAEAARRAERRMNKELNDRIDPNIAKLNAQYQKIREMLNKTGLFPRIWNLSSTTQYINWSVLLGNIYQPSAPIPAPEFQPTNGLAVQIHQSALNNMLAIALAGRSVDEEKFSERIGEFFEETPEFLKRKAGESPAKVSFGQRAPIDVLFVDNKIRVVVRLNDIRVLDNASRSFVISVEYQIKREKRDGQDIIVLEQTEAEAVPAGFGQGNGTTLSATQTIIRTYLLRRLEALSKRYESEPLDLGGEWKGKGQLIPQLASTEKGWLTLVWSWQPL